MSYLHYPSDEDGGLVMLSKASKLNKLKLTKQNKYKCPSCFILHIYVAIF